MATGGDDVPDPTGEAPEEAAGPTATASVAITNSPITVAQTLSLTPFLTSSRDGGGGVGEDRDRRVWERTAQMFEQQAAILEQILGRLRDMEARERSRAVRERLVRVVNVIVPEIRKLGGAVYLRAKVQGKLVYALLDIGCEHSLIGKKWLPSDIQVEATDCRLVAANGTKILLLGQV